MAKTVGQIKDIVRKVTGRTDQSISDQVIFNYIEDFYTLIMGQEMRLFDRKSYYKFDLVAGTTDYAIDLSAIGFSLLQAPAWVESKTAGEAAHQLYFSVNPEVFFAKWPENVTYTQQRPEDVLWYDNKLIFRAPPDAVYSIKISAYKINPAFGNSPGSENIAEDYWFRYLAYGAAIDLLSDSGEFEKVAQVMPLFERYKSIVNARTYTQLGSKRFVRNF